MMDRYRRKRDYKAWLGSVVPVPRQIAACQRTRGRGRGTRGDTRAQAQSRRCGSWIDSVEALTAIIGNEITIVGMKLARSEIYYIFKIDYFIRNAM